MKQHSYALGARWIGNLGEGTASYRGYSRNHDITAPDKGLIPCSSEPVFRGDPTRYNPEELLVASLSGCHLLWFLHKCVDAGVILEEYEDAPTGTMVEDADGGGHFVEVVLRPRARFRGEVDEATLRQLHEASHALCFVARSVKFPVRVEPRVDLAVNA